MFVKALLLTCCLSFLGLDVGLAQEGKSYPADMADRVQACTPCHGQEGRGTNDPYFPRLAGKPAGYLYNQLEAFKSGRRKYPPMNYLLAFLTDDYLRQIADYFADQHPALPGPPATDASKSVLEHGQALVTQGDLDRAIPACVSCHGGPLTGQSPGIPGLLGLRASYISAQLGGWRYGTRTANAPDCMQLVAGRLTEDDVRAVAAYLAGQPLPTDPVPAPAGSFALPFACGSQPDGGHKP
ncbi:cytochrome-c oxidase [Rhizobium grahamii CCGE 502]|uniref:Cytochrome-c oxidase n=1 Tax=Rhizobium grahamii CCGE 502 TaxID=990285 RepID=S3H8Y8_9HYPH|nr:cytochrome-c oxidase [Rhizobium grahamii CCGE 502]